MKFQKRSIYLQKKKKNGEDFTGDNNFGTFLLYLHHVKMHYNVYFKYI